jgi:heme/copper-type cytochrome/quinol oxidase subunit 1
MTFSWFFVAFPWIGGAAAVVLAVLLFATSPRHPLVGFALYSVISINALVHIVAVLASGQPYNPGLLTALVLFIPLTVWVSYTGFRDNRLTPKPMVVLPVWGVILHVAGRVSGHVRQRVHQRAQQSCGPKSSTLDCCCWCFGLRNGGKVALRSALCRANNCPIAGDR